MFKIFSLSFLISLYKAIGYMIQNYLLLFFIGFITLVSWYLYLKIKNKKNLMRLKQEKEVAYKIHMGELRQSSIDEIDQMNGPQFEEYLSSLYQSLGYNTEVTKGSGDFGADLILKNNDETIIVQAKRYSNKVSIQAVQEIVAAKGFYNANHAWVVTNNYYTGPAHKLADANDVLLIDRDLLIKISAQVNRQNEQPATNLEQSSY